MKNGLSTFLLGGFLLLQACAKTIYPPTEPHAYFAVDEQIFQLTVGPYVNAMPGTDSPYIIIGMEFQLAHTDTFELWNRAFKITKIDIPGVSKKYTDISNLDHSEWLSNDSNRKVYNVLRVPDSILDRQFNMNLMFKDDTGKKYQIAFHSLYAGNVY